MSQSEQSEKPATPKRSDPVWPIVLISLTLLAGICLGGYFLLPGLAPETTSSPPPASEQAPVTAPGSGPVESLGPAESQEPQPLPVQETPAVAAADEAPAGPAGSDSPAEQCLRLGRQLQQFFVHLDQEEYFRKFTAGTPAQAYFEKLANQLLARPPVVTRESDALYTILKNMAHFFRVIGRKNILLIKAMLDRERDKIEDIAADFYRWSIEQQCDQPQFRINASLDKFYDYAGFFLTTMGGRSYLFRRDSRSRLLVDYYAVLIVDRANQKKMNRHGIDLGKILPPLIQEIENSSQLIYKEEYLDSLYDLEEKYQQ